MDLSTDQKKTKRKLVTGGQEPYWITERHTDRKSEPNRDLWAIIKRSNMNNVRVKEDKEREWSS
jgi:hypothetical protein